LAHHEVLTSAGLAGCAGLALGMGLDRILMLRKHIPDIRLLRSAHPQVASQMCDLSPYRPVSNLPSIRRDLSIAVGVDRSPEDIGDRVREALGDGSDVIEEILVLSETAHADLSRTAVERLGMTDRQKNLLISLTIRPLERTLSDADANLIRDRVYDVVHEGAHHQWATPSGLPARVMLNDGGQCEIPPCPT
jgi:phenylalanyl-tRNA synthetase alpha chain